MKLRAMLAACLLSLASVLPATAALFTYDAVLSPEAPGATGTGHVVVEMDDSDQSMDIDALWSGLSASAITAHIHCCTVAPNTGTAGIAVNAVGFPPEKAGTYVATLLLVNFASLLAGLDAGTAYFDIHNSFFPAGEIRGFFERCGGTTGNPCETIAAVPEPATLALVGLGLAGLGFSRRKQ